MKAIKPIETRYKGYRFRSRLEARWAVFFDAMGFSWQYEPEGFQTSAGWYLPDFLVQGIWMEVKPGWPTEAEYEKCQALAEGIDRATYIIFGDPWPGEYEVLYVHPTVYVEALFAFSVSPCCGCMALADERAKFWVPLCDHPGNHFRDTEEGELENPVLLAAFAAARSARFDGRAPTQPPLQMENPW